MEITEEELVKQIKDEFKDKILDTSTNDEFRIDILVDVDALVSVATYLKHDLGFLIPDMCIGTDYKDKMQVVWYIGTPDGPTLVALKVEVDRDECVVPALTPIWEGLNWHERETYDLLGVNFDGHPDLRRILLPENWEGHPLREDYVYKKPIYRKPEDFQ